MEQHKFESHGLHKFVYHNEYLSEHIATFVVDDMPDPKGGYCLVPRLQRLHQN